MKNKRLIALAAAIFVGAASYALGWSTLFTVSSVEVTGTDQRLPQSIKVGEKLARVEPRAVAATYEKFAFVQDAQVSRNWISGKVTISITSRTPVAIFNNQAIDDYGHHPTEIDVTLKAARRFAGDGRLIVIFQPHRYSRTKAFSSQFAKVLDMADRAIVLEVYAASEKPIAGVTSRLITDAMSHGEYIPNFIEVTDSVIDSAEPQDVIITLGAGDVSSLAPIIVDGLSRRFG